MDVEDPINPLADDAALDIARIFKDTGVRGSFCITGEKCRSLMARGRKDVLEAFKPHCLGLHTDTHSYHPTTMERFADVTYEAGCEEAHQCEGRGHEAFQRAFGRSAAFWGGAGNTWSAEIANALRHLRIPAYSYALTRFPGDPVHRFNGVFALPQHLSVSEIEWRDDAKAAPAIDRVLLALQATTLPWVGIFVGHPTKLRHVDYWDTPFFGGRTPPEPELTEPVPEADFERGKTNIASFLRSLKAAHRTVGVDELMNMSWDFREPSRQEREFFERETASNIRGAARWPVHRPRLDPENMVRKALALADTAEIGFLPD